MKRLIFSSVFLLCVGLTVFAQTEERASGTTTKSGRQILPQAGDFGLSIDAAPALNYLGGFLSNAGANGNDVFQSTGIAGQYFLSSDRSIRAKLNIGFKSGSEITGYELKTGATEEKVENKKTESSSTLGLLAGYAFHRGYGRLQAFYGPEVGIRFGNYGKINHDYGNTISQNNILPSRILEINSGSIFGFRAGGFVGVEYFFAPKISIGGEFGLAISYDSLGNGSIKSEGWDYSNSKVKETETKLPGGGSNFKLGTITSGNVNVTFYF